MQETYGHQRVDLVRLQMADEVPLVFEVLERLELRPHLLNAVLGDQVGACLDRDPDPRRLHRLGRQQQAHPFALAAGSQAGGIDPVVHRPQARGDLGRDPSSGTGSGVCPFSVAIAHLGEHRSRPAGLGLSSLVGDHVGDRIDQGQVGEGLGEVAEVTIGSGVDFLGEQVQVAG